MSFEQTEKQVIKWAEDRKILPNSTSQTQLLKTMSELGELADAILKGDRAGIIDGLGDVLATLIIVAAKEDLNLVACLECAYDEIKDRTGTMMPNGVFVKDGK